MLEFYRKYCVAFSYSFGEKNIRAFVAKKLAALTANFSVLPKLSLVHQTFNSN